MHSFFRSASVFKSTVLFHCISVVLACFFLVTSGLADGLPPQPGHLDLSHQNFDSATIYTLDADWKVAWGDFYDPQKIPDSLIKSDCNESDCNASTHNFSYPSVWNNTVRPDGSTGPYGIATLYLRVDFPSDLEGVYLKLSDLPAAGKLWANGVEVIEQGKIGRSFDSEIPGFGPDTVYIPLNKSTKNMEENQVLFALHLSNFHFKEGGAWHSIKVSGESGLNYLATFPAVSDSALTILLMVLGGLFLSLYLARTQEMAALYFGCFCLAVGIRNGITGEHILNQWLPFVSWTISQKLEHILMFISVPLFTVFAHHLYPQYRSITAERAFTAIAAVFSLITAITPSTLFTLSSQPYQIVILVFLMYLLRIAFLALKHKRNSSGIFLLSFIVLSVMVFLDVLTHNMLLQLPLLTEWGVAIFVIMQAWLLNQRYAFSLNNEEALSQRLQQKNKELQKLDAMKDDFLAQTSHELRTPIHGISSLTELVLQQETQLDKDSTTNLNLIHSSSVRLANLVNDILDLSSIKHNQLKLNLVAVSLPPVIEQVIQSLRPLLKGRPVSLQTHWPSTLPKVMADESRLQQILFNLIGNAIKFTPKGEIQVQVDMIDDQRIQVRVKDTGLGFDVSESDKLFEAFHQGTEPGMSASGHGLGLTITRDLLKMHQSELQVKSVPGHGSTFYFNLEAAIHIPASVQEITRRESLEFTDPTEQQHQSQDSYQERREFERSNESVDPIQNDQQGKSYPLVVWAVDDEPVNLQILENQLTSFGYQYRGFSLGKQMLEALEQDEQPDLLLLDIMMPGLNGLEVCEILRKQYSSLELPIIMLTARQQTKDIVEAFNAGASDHLAKPYNQTELKVRVEAQIKASLCHELSQSNEQLITDLEDTEHLQQQLQHRNQLLLTVFDASSTPLLVLNKDLSLEYQNLAMTHLIRAYPEVFTDHQLTALIERIRNNLDQLIPSHRWLDIFSEINHRMIVHQFQHDKTVGYSVILEELSTQSSLATERSNLGKPNDQTGAELADINNDAIEERVRLLEELVTQLSSSSISNNLEHHQAEASPLVSDDPQQSQKTATENVTETKLQSAHSDTKVQDYQNQAHQIQARKTLVEATRLALRLWQKHTNKSKAELAEESGIWRIYIDGGTLKTRTLDKYLSEKTLPQKPRWRSVIKTLDYLIQHCTLKDEEKQRLEILITEIEEYHLSK